VSVRAGTVVMLNGLAFVAACVIADPGTAIHVEPGSTAQELVLHAFVGSDSLAPNRGLMRVEVRQCFDRAAQQEGRVVWAVERPALRAPSAPRSPYLAYGTLPGVSWVTQTAPEPLGPGCYWVTAQGGGIGAATRFVVSASGAIRDSARSN
jgi:hypothetical protein